jgi:hypothetical protein
MISILLRIPEASGMILGPKPAIWMRVVIFFSPTRQMLGSYLKIGPYDFVP